ncbi:unnamed protein product [Tilletia caries]|nr:unnamed protein product [Tilletia caries]CAD6946990.1 unnamed protein product [Tilletia caries]
MSANGETQPPNATADQLPGNSSAHKHKDRQRAGTAAVEKAANATSASTTQPVPGPPSTKDSNKHGTAPAPAPAPASNTLTNILGHYASTARPSTARIDPAAQPNSSPIALTIGNLWRYIPLVASAASSITSAIASHAIYGPPKKSWGVEMTIFTRIMRDCGTRSEFATISGLQQFFDLGSLLPVPKDGLITPVTFRVKTRNLRGFLKDPDAAEDGKRELTGEWVVTKSTWKRLQSEWRTKTGATATATAGAGVEKSNSTSSVTTSSSEQRSHSVPPSSQPKQANGKPTTAAVNGTPPSTNTNTSPPQKSTSPTGTAAPNGTAPNVDFKRSDSTRGTGTGTNANAPRRERIIYYIHGGAYFVMSAATHRPLTISLSKYAECRVFAINYRLAPDTKFPGALHDCVAAWFRLVDDLGIPPRNIVLGADSAGGGLALALLCYLRDEKYELPAGAMLFSPWVDLTLSCDSWDTNSKYDYLPMPPSGNHMNPVHAYLGDDIEQYLTHPYVSPLFADMHGLPPLLIQCGDAEVLRDEGTLLAHKASLAGVSVRHELYEDCVHVFQAFLFLDASRKALQSARHFMRTALDRPSASGSSRRMSRSVRAKKVATASDPRRKLLAEEAAAAGSTTGGDDTGTETEGEDGKEARATKAAAARLDAATRDRMDAEMRSGMGNVRGQRVEPSTGERERRHHHHHHHHGASRKVGGGEDGKVTSSSFSSSSAAGAGSGAGASAAERSSSVGGKKQGKSVLIDSDSSSDSDEEVEDEDEDEEFAYARTKKGSATGNLSSSAAAAFKAMHQRRTPSSSSLSAAAGAGATTTTTTSSSAAESTTGPTKKDSADDAELWATTFHPPKSVLTPRMRQSSLVGLSTDVGASLPPPAMSASSASSSTTTTGESSASLPPPGAGAAGAAEGSSNESPSASASASASGSLKRPTAPHLLKRDKSSAAISSLMESYAANPGVLRTNVWTPSGEGGADSGGGAGGGKGGE